VIYYRNVCLFITQCSVIYSGTQDTRCDWIQLILCRDLLLGNGVGSSQTLKLLLFANIGLCSLLLVVQLKMPVSNVYSCIMILSNCICTDGRFAFVFLFQATVCGSTSYWCISLQILPQVKIFSSASLLHVNVFHKSVWIFDLLM